MGKTLVVLGAGPAGMPIAHYVLRFSLPKMPDLKVIVVTPESEQYWSLAAPRGIVKGQFTDEQIFTPIAPGFEKYPEGSYEIVEGRAETLSPDNNKVTVVTNSGTKRTIDYDFLVIATGASSNDHMPWKNLETTEKTKEALHRIQHQVFKAESVLVGGGGTTGVEMAGEIAFEHQKAIKAGEKKVYLVMDKELPLYPSWRDDIRLTAQTELENLGVTLVANSRVTGTESTPKSDETTVHITNLDGGKSSIKVDVYLSTTGQIPNSSFVPSHLRDEAGYVKQGEDLRVPGYQNLFVVGDVGALEPSNGFVAGKQVEHINKILPGVLAGNPDVQKYNVDGLLMAGVTVGRSRATGQAGTWRLPSLAIWWFKGRYLGTNYSKEIAQGLRAGPKGRW